MASSIAKRRMLAAAARTRNSSCWPPRPVEDLNRHCGVATEEAVGVVADEHQGAEQEQRRCFPKGTRQREDRAGRDPRHGLTGGSDATPSACGVAPRASDPCRISTGTALRASRVAMIMTARISSPSANAPAITRFLF